MLTLYTLVVLPADHFCHCCFGILKGIEKQNLVTAAILIFYYLFALPFGGFAAFKLGFGLIGLWSGYAIANWFMGGYLSYRIYKMDWKQQCIEANTRVEEDKKIRID